MAAIKYALVALMQISGLGAADTVGNEVLTT